MPLGRLREEVAESTLVSFDTERASNDSIRAGEASAVRRGTHFVRDTSLRSMTFAQTPVASAGLKAKKGADE